jgi:precorrin-8X/cobalt-precorrin-8 methylmutase
MTLLGQRIEDESFRILAGRVDLSHYSRQARLVVARMIHASADLEYASTTFATEDAVEAGIAAICSGAPVIADVEMTRHGIRGVDACCHMPPPGKASPKTTRAAAGIRAAASAHPAGAVVVIGCAPTALEEVLNLHDGRGFEPALVIGLPVGFVGAAEAKTELRASGIPSISNAGEKGGSAVAAAATNALARLARAASHTELNHG